MFFQTNLYLFKKKYTFTFNLKLIYVLNVFVYFSSNLADVAGVRVLANVEIVRFLQRAVQCFPEKLSDKAWDFILCTAVSLIQVEGKSYHGWVVNKLTFRPSINF